MSTVIHKVLLQSEQHFEGKLPSHHLGLLLAEVPLAIRETVSMALRNRSAVKGRRPGWLERASDVRFVGHEGNGETTLFFEAPVLGEAAPEIYVQGSLFPELRPDPQDTGFDLFGDILADIQQRDADSEHFDPPLLHRITRFHKVFAKRSPFSEIDITSRRYVAQQPARFTPQTIASANLLLGETPASQRVRVVGQLDGLEASTQRFSVLLDTGEKIVGVFAEEQIDAMHKLWRERIVVLGTAVYRASGRLLRIEAEAVKQGENEPGIFSQMPVPSHAKLDVSKLRKPQGPRSGMAVIMGQWPGDESDDEIQAALERLS
jgi:hypothetical protein